MKKQDTNKGRRKVLQKVGVASGVAATAVWTKPSLNSVLLPAHAQMSATMQLLGGTSSSSPVTSTNNSKNKSIASRALDALVPAAQANGSFETCGAFTQNGPDDYRHCIDLTFDEIAPDTGFMMNLTGPDVYYNMCHYDSGYAYYNGVANFSGSANGTLVGQDFTVSIGEFEFNGTVADDFQSASGTLVKNTKGYYFLGGDSGNGAAAACGYEYSAHWAVTTGGECSPGAGAATTDGRSIVVVGLCPCAPS